LAELKTQQNLNASGQARRRRSDLNINLFKYILFKYQPMTLKFLFKHAATYITVPPNLVEEKNRQKAVLNILLFFSIAAFVIINIIRIIDHIIYNEERGLPLWSTLLILIFLFFLAALSRHGKIRFASILLIFLYSLPMVFCLIVWGADLPAGLLLAVLIITMSVVLLGAGVAFTVTGIIAVFLIFITELQSRNILIVQDYWRQETNQISDAVVYSVLLLVSAGIAWLFAHGINQSLARAKNSEEALKKERDSLEIKVKERTQELRQAEQEKINQLYRLAEFGRLSSGVFHDLINPLTAVSLNLEQVAGEAESPKPDNQGISQAKSYLRQALLAAHKMENLIAGVKRQIQKESGPTTFTPSKEITEIIQILAFKARRANVKIDLTGEEELNFTGDAVKFGQIIINLLANAIDASENSPAAQEIKINLTQGDDRIIITISDQGSGIAPENIDKIFEPFFSTKKKSGQGLGIGLATTKDIVEKNFGGTVGVISELGAGSLFTVSLPFNSIKNEN